MRVDPRMSAKSRVSSISAPPGCVRTNTSHWLQYLGFIVEGPKSVNRLSTREIGPESGIRQVLQRGLPGMCLRRRRYRWIADPSPVRSSRQSCSFSAGSGIGSFFATGRALSSRAARRDRGLGLVYGPALDRRGTRDAPRVAAQRIDLTLQLAALPRELALLPRPTAARVRERREPGVELLPPA